MTNWEKIIKRLLIILFLVLLGLEICMEVRYPCDEIVLKSDDRAAILRKNPEIEIGENDRSFLEEISQCPSIENLLNSEEKGFVFAPEDPDVRAVTEVYLESSLADSVTANVLFQEDGTVTIALNWGETGRNIFWLRKTESKDEAEYFKACSYDGPFQRRTIYENWDNERVQKSEVHRRWFAWFRDGMWKEG